MKNKTTNKVKKDEPVRFSDQAEYYFNHLKKQQKAMKNKFSILGRHHNNLDSFVRTGIKSLPLNSKVLDAGCGLSAWTTPQLRKKYTISGMDGEPEAIEVCKKIYPNQDYRVGDLYNLTYKPNSFDAVVMREVIEHFVDPEKAVKEVYKILKPGGIFIVTTPNYSSTLLHIIENTYNRFFGGPCKPYRDDVHPSKFKPHTLQKLLSKYFILDKLTTIDYGISQTGIARKRK
jgi:2-polyprenyl-3-methyl-5-hydroxy-6-metoxy-1,4-benzoquinol methylase